MSTAEPQTAPVRTRFAPSPTGFLHIGGFRTIIFSWLLARRHGGQFALRVEDTDQQRTVPGVVEDFLEGFRWMGIDLDEGPIIGGPFGPYYQSQRRDLYAAYAHQLVASGHAYRCFCSKERLEEMYADQQARHLPTTGYDRRCRKLSPSEIDANLAAGQSYVVRIAIPTEGDTIVPDALRGDVVFHNRALEDLVLLKSDGYPTYHLASVIDDHLMRFTHILRGDEWLSTAPIHKLIYDALHWEWPITAHVPSVMGSDGRKLSKRRGAQSILYYRDQGFLPQAIINYLALLGWSYDDKTEILTVDQLQRAFSLDRVQRSGAVFDEERMKWFNGVYIRQMAIDELLDYVLPFMERPAAEGGLPDEVARPLDRAFVRRVVQLDQERLKLLTDAVQLTDFFFAVTLTYPVEWLIGKGLDAASARSGMERALGILESNLTWEAAVLEEAMRQLATDMGVKPGPLFMGLRVAVTGRKETPPLFATMEILGREETLKRVRSGLELLAAL